MNTLRLCVTLMLGALCGATISEVPLPEQVQECYDKADGADSYVGSKLSWMCENKINNHISEPEQQDDQENSYYKHLMEICLPSNNTDDGETVPRHKRQTRRRRCLRKEYRMLSDEERTRFHNTLKALKRDTSVYPNKYDSIAQFHVRAMRYAHGGPGFFGWHRFYINMAEAAFQEVDPLVCMPYWDNTLDSELQDAILSNIWSPEFMGTPIGPVVDGPCANWTTLNGGPLLRNVGFDGEPMTPIVIRNILSRFSYDEITDSPRTQLRYNLEYHHGAVHMLVGGAMTQLNTAASDPLFFLHHTFIDYIWERFRARLRSFGRNPELYPDTVSRASPHHSSYPTGFGSLRHMDAYRNIVSDTFEYQPVPTCSSSSLQCGSRYLTCKVSIGRCVPTEASTVVSSPPEPTNTQREVVRVFSRRRERRSETAPPALQPDPPITQSPVISSTQLPGGVPIDTSCLKREKFLGQAVQNDFCCDSKCDTNEWVIIPVKIINVRPPRFKKYKSYPVHNGRIDRNFDIYSPRAYNQTNRFIAQRRSNPQTYGRCKIDDSVGQVLLSSRGINYYGFYEETAIVDQRLSASISLGFVAVKKPVAYRVSTAIIRAHDSCGRECQAACLDPLTGYFKECKGAIAVSAKKPLMYGRTYDEAIMSVFDYEHNSNLPQFETDSFFIAFYCGYHNKFPYATNRTGGVYQPSIAVNPPDHVVAPSNTECLVTPQCILDIPCVSTERQCSLDGKKHICRGSCQEYAVCMGGQFSLKVCPEDFFFDNVHKMCVPGDCD